MWSVGRVSIFDLRIVVHLEFSSLFHETLNEQQSIVVFYLHVRSLATREVKKKTAQKRSTLESPLKEKMINKRGIIMTVLQLLHTSHQEPIRPLKRGKKEKKK